MINPLQEIKGCKMNAFQCLELIKKLKECNVCKAHSNSFKVEFIEELMVVRCKCGYKKVFNSSGDDVTKDNKDIKIPLNHYSRYEKSEDIKYLDYKGCGKCKLNGACEDYKKNVTIIFKKSEVADCWGRRVAVFLKGEMVKAQAVIKDNKVYCATAKSSRCRGYEDFIKINNVIIETL